MKNAETFSTEKQKQQKGETDSQIIEVFELLDISLIISADTENIKNDPTV